MCLMVEKNHLIKVISLKSQIVITIGVHQYIMISSLTTGGDPHIKMPGVLGTRISFDGRCSNGFLRIRGTNIESSCHSLSGQHPKRYRDNCNGGHFRFQYPRPYRSTNFDPKGAASTTQHFLFLYRSSLLLFPFPRCSPAPGQ